MRIAKIDILVIPLGINFRWLFGLLEEPSERLLVGIIGSEGLIEMIAPAFEIDRIKHKTGISNINGWEEVQNPYKILCNTLSTKENKTVGIDPKMWFYVYEKIKKECPQQKFISAENLFHSLRSLKTDEEQKLILKASQKSSDTIVKILNELEQGVTEIEVQSLLKKKLIWGHNEQSFSLVQFAENTSLPHFHGGGRKLKKNDVVLIDAGGTLKNYWGDITITSVFGRASSRFRDIYDIVYEANKLGKEAVVQDRLPSEVDFSTRSYITKKGYGEYFTHRTGHGIGLEIHEPPYIVENNYSPLEPGNTFTIEPGIYLPKEFGIRVEDNVIKTPTGIQTSIIPRYELLEI